MSNGERVVSIRVGNRLFLQLKDLLLCRVCTLLSASATAAVTRSFSAVSDSMREDGGGYLARESGGGLSAVSQRAIDRGQLLVDIPLRASALASRNHPRSASSASRTSLPKPSSSRRGRSARSRMCLQRFAAVGGRARLQERALTLRGEASHPPETLSTRRAETLPVFRMSAAICGLAASAAS